MFDVSVNNSNSGKIDSLAVDGFNSTSLPKA
jgi:hypothetical protein